MRLALILGLVLPAVAHAGWFNFFKHDVQVITVTDATPAGALLRQPSPAHPVYYGAISLGYRDFGGIIAGDKLPAKEAMIRTIATVLAKQGYLPATKAHPPTLLLVWAWGTMYVDRMYNPSLPDFEGQQVNRNQMLRFLGGYKVGLVEKQPTPFEDDMLQPGLMFRTADADSIYDAATDDLYVAALGAYDYRAAVQKRRVLLWMTKISCPSRGLVLADVLPTMLAIAGPNIGRETAKPVWTRATDKYKPNVIIGDSKVVEYIDSGKMPVLDAGSSKPRGK